MHRKIQVSYSVLLSYKDGGDIFISLSKLVITFESWEQAMVAYEETSKGDLWQLADL